MVKKWVQGESGFLRVGLLNFTEEEASLWLEDEGGMIGVLLKVMPHSTGVVPIPVYLKPGAQLCSSPDGAVMMTSPVYQPALEKPGAGE